MHLLYEPLGTYYARVPATDYRIRVRPWVGRACNEALLAPVPGCVGPGRAAPCILDSAQVFDAEVRVCSGLVQRPIPAELATRSSDHVLPNSRVVDRASKVTVMFARACCDVKRHFLTKPGGLRVYVRSGEKWT